MVNYNDLDRLANILILGLQHHINSTGKFLALRDFDLNDDAHLCILTLGNILATQQDFPIYIENISLLKRIKLRKKTRIKVKRAKEGAYKTLDCPNWITYVSMKLKSADKLHDTRGKLINLHDSMDLIYNIFYKEK